MSFMTTFLNCFGLERNKLSIFPEKSADDKRANDTVQMILRAEKNDSTLRRELNSVNTNGWSESLASAILHTLEAALREGAIFGQAVREALEKAEAAAIGFAKDHPVYCTILALGVLVMMAPWVIEALGFGELGIMEGKSDWTISIRI